MCNLTFVLYAEECALKHVYIVKSIYLTFITIYSYNFIFLAVKTQEKSTFLATFKHTKQYSYKGNQL